jgi:hypothetical protein
MADEWAAAVLPSFALFLPTIPLLLTDSIADIAFFNSTYLSSIANERERKLEFAMKALVVDQRCIKTDHPILKSEPVASLCIP